MDILLLVISLSLANGFRQFVGGVCKEDRRIAVTQFSWVYGPLAIVCCVFLVFFINSFRLGGLVADFCQVPIYEDCQRTALVYIQQNTPPGLRPLDIYFYLFGALISTSWALASAPIARIWALSRASDPQQFLVAEEKAILTRGQKAIEPHLSVPAYYSLLIGGFALAFLVLESVVGETLDRFMGTSGYLGAVIATLFLAALFGLIRRRADVYVRYLKEAAGAAESDDIVSASREVIQSTGKLWLSILKDWPMVLIYILVAVIVFFSVILHYNLELRGR